MWWYRQGSNLHELSALSNPSGWVKLQYSSCVYQFRHDTNARLSGRLFMLFRYF